MTFLRPAFPIAAAFCALLGPASADTCAAGIYHSTNPFNYFVGQYVPTTSPNTFNFRVCHPTNQLISVKADEVICATDFSACPTITNLPDYTASVGYSDLSEGFAAFGMDGMRIYSGGQGAVPDLRFIDAAVAADGTVLSYLATRTMDDGVSYYAIPSDSVSAWITDGELGFVTDGNFELDATRIPTIHGSVELPADLVQPWFSEGIQAPDGTQYFSSGSVIDVQLEAYLFEIPS